MKRVPITQKDYPENYNNVAKYIGRNWNDKKLSLEQSRQLLAYIIGYSSIYELEKSFVDKLPNLIDTEALKHNILSKLEDKFAEDFKTDDIDFIKLREMFREYRDNTFSKIPFYHLSALNTSKQDIFSGKYEKVAEYHPLYIESFRYGGGFYGLLLPNPWVTDEISTWVDGDKTTNFVSFMFEYECFPFGQGNSHISVLTQISERANKYFDEHGNWDFEIINPEGEYLGYREVMDEIMSWYKEDNKESSGTPWYVVDAKKRENHWLIKALNSVMVSFEARNKTKETPKKEAVEDEKPSKVPKIFLLDEAHSFPSDIDFSKFR